MKTLTRTWRPGWLALIACLLLPNAWSWGQYPIEYIEEYPSEEWIQEESWEWPAQRQAPVTEYREVILPSGEIILQPITPRQPAQPQRGVYPPVQRQQTRRVPTPAASNAPRSATTPLRAEAGTSKRYQGADYETGAGIGFDQRTEDVVGGSFDSKDGGFVGARKSVGAGLYGDAQASQSGKIGNVEIRNYAQAEGFVGSELGAEAGISKEGVVVGANGFTGGRVSGTVGSDVGPIGYGATGEAWSGAGLEAGVNAGFDDGVLTFGGELGGALGVGGKIGVQGSIDVGAIGDGAKKVVGKVGDTAKDVGRDVGQAAKRVGGQVGDTAKKVGGNVGKTARNVGNSAKKLGKGLGDAAKGLFKKKK